MNDKDKCNDDGLNWLRDLLVCAVFLWLGIWLSGVEQSIGDDQLVSTRFLLALAGTLSVAHFLRKRLARKKKGANGSD
ncbi:hypothetical protein OAS39_09025 [Pirellulales bacterium]|nr:hypothetical protein [Pirellulales bacterium]